MLETSEIFRSSKTPGPRRRWPERSCPQCAGNAEIRARVGVPGLQVPKASMFRIQVE